MKDGDESETAGTEEGCEVQKVAINASRPDIHLEHRERERERAGKAVVEYLDPCRLVSGTKVLSLKCTVDDVSDDGRRETSVSTQECVCRMHQVEGPCKRRPGLEGVKGATSRHPRRTREDVRLGPVCCWVHGNQYDVRST